MNRPLKYFIGLWLFALIAICLIVINYFNITNFATRFPPYIDYTGATILGISAVIAAIITHQIIKRYQTRKTFTAEVLICYFSFSALLAILQSISSIIGFEFKKLDNLFTSAGYFIICPMIVFLALFNVDVFYSTEWNRQKKVRFISVIGIGMGVFCGYIFKDILFSSTKMEVLIFGVLMLCIAITIYLQLAISAGKLAKRFEIEHDELMHRSFRYLRSSGITLSGGFLLTLVYNFIRPAAYTTFDPVMVVNWISFILFLIGYILLYVGFILPMRQPVSN